MEWIKCSERMPKHGERVIFSTVKVVYAGYWDDGLYLRKPVGKWNWNGRIFHGDVTHWMPLPAPPTE